jgi:ribosomal protein L22
VSDRVRHASPANRVRVADDLNERQTDEAERLLLATAAAVLQSIEAGREFLRAAQGADQGRVAERAAEQVRAALQSASMRDAHAAFWRQTAVFFGWRDVATLEPAGAA